MAETKNKDHAIELVRIIACLLVIMAHSQLGVVENNSIVSGRLAFSTFIADDVPLFLLVTGFFFFNRVHSDSSIIQAFPYKAKSFLSRIYIPTIIYILISILYRYFTGAQSSIVDADWDYLGRFLFRLAPGDHLWYICTYMSFVFFFPMLAFVCQNDPQKNKLRRVLLGVAIAGTIITDVQYFFKMNLFDIEKFLWGYCTIFLIIGYELSLFLPKFKDQKKKLFAIGVALYLAGFLIKYGLQDYMFIKYGYVSNRFRWLQCTPCFITAAGMFLSTYSIGSLIKRGGIPSRIINFVGSCTFAIYLFQMLVISETGGWRNFFFMKFGHETTFFSTFAYYLSYAFAVFGVALIIAAIFKYAIEKPIERLFRRWLVQR